MNLPSDGLDETTGAILVGGQSRRLGRDKVLLSYQNRPIVLHIHGILSALFPQVLLIGHSRPELDSRGLTCIPDLIQGLGVLGGIYTALVTADTPYVFITGADMPFITVDLISGILQRRHGADAVVPLGPGGLEPLCAVYARTCTETIRRNLEGGRLKVMEALEGLAVLTPAIVPAAGEPDPFLNINYPEDWETLKKKT